jgi:hypothetical protein
VWRKLTIAGLFLLLLVNMAYAGNFNSYNNLLVQTFSLIPGPALNGFKMYKSEQGGLIVGVLVEKDWIIEAFVACKGDVTRNDFITVVSSIYAIVQETRYKVLKHNEAEIIMSGDANMWKNRANEMISIAYKQLYHTTETTFVFDGLHVRAMDVGKVRWKVKGAEYDPDKMFSIKVWIK